MLVCVWIWWVSFWLFIWKETHCIHLLLGLCVLFFVFVFIFDDIFWISYIVSFINLLFFFFWWIGFRVDNVIVSVIHFCILYFIFYFFNSLFSFVVITEKSYLGKFLILLLKILCWNCFAFWSLFLFFLLAKKEIEIENNFLPARTIKGKGIFSWIFWLQIVLNFWFIVY